MKIRIKYRCATCGDFYSWVDVGDVPVAVLCRDCGASSIKVVTASVFTGTGKGSIEEFDIDRAVGRAAETQLNNLSVREAHKAALRDRFGEIIRTDRIIQDPQQATVSVDHRGKTLIDKHATEHGVFEYTPQIQKKGV